MTFHLYRVNEQVTCDIAGNTYSGRIVETTYYVGEDRYEYKVELENLPPGWVGRVRGVMDGEAFRVLDASIEFRRMTPANDD